MKSFIDRKIFLFHRTVGPEYDDRIQKIFGSLAGDQLTDACAFLWERKNQSREGVFKEGGRFEVLRLPFASRRLPRPGPVWSLYEILAESWMGFRLVSSYKPSVVVVQNHRLFGLVQLLSLWSVKSFRLVWDLRELPTGFLKKGSVRAGYFAKLLRKCDSVIVTNESRKSYMRQIFGELALVNSFVVPNYPSCSFASRETLLLSESSAKRLPSTRFLYLQNPSSEGRYPGPAIDAVLRYTDLSVVVSGRLEERARAHLESEWGENFAKRVVLTGMINSDEIIHFLDRCMAAMVFYNWDRPNSDFCDPNRLYQAIARGVPVVVGGNAGMKPIVEDLGCGVVTEGDGRSVEDIGKALERLQAGYKEYRKRAMDRRAQFSWEENEKSLREAILGEESITECLGAPNENE